MIKKALLLSIVCIALFSHERVEKIALGKIYRTSAKVVVFKNQRQNIVAQIPGHVERYFVKDGDNVKSGEKIAKIKSFYLAQMSTKYLQLQSEIAILQKRLANAKKLYKKGLITYNNLANIKVKLQSLRSQFAALKLKLQILGITEISKPIEYFYLTSHANGIVQKIIIPVHANVDSQTPLVQIVSDESFFAEAYLRVADAMHLQDVQGEFYLGGFSYKAHFIKVMPEVDKQTLQAKILFQLESSRPLLIGAYGEMAIQSAPYREALAIKRSALTMLQGDWVVFVPKEDKHEHEDEHEELDFEPRVVKVVEFWGKYAIIEGLKENQEYIDENIYIYKSRLLKESLGEHGH